MKDLTIMVPSRGRPHNIEKLKEDWDKNSTANSSLVVLVDDDDPKLDEYLKIHEETVVGPRLRIGGTLNKFAPEIAKTAKNIGFLGDDHRTRTYGWDSIFIEELNKMKVGVVYGNDLLQGENLATAVAMTSNIVTTLGYFCVPGSIHLFLDNFWMEIGKGTKIKYLPDVIIEHIHPSAGKSEFDEGYAQANSSSVWAADEATFENYVKNDLHNDLLKLKALENDQ